ncbi:MAG TPA: ATP-binding protein, partial [Terriglobales bacterium]|nr:ATP-binding protein [Terriglobales bacterium]
MLAALRRRIVVKLTVTLVGFVALSILVAGFYLGDALERAAVDSLEARLATGGRLLRGDAAALLARPPAPAALYEWAARAAEAANARVTLVRADGVVVADSHLPPGDLARVDNHATRPEIGAALAGRIGRSTRRSSTVDIAQLYVGVPVAEGGTIRGVVRLAMPLTEVSSSFAPMHRVLLAGGFVALAVAAAIGIFVAGRVTRPVVEMEAIARRMAAGDFDRRVPVRSPDEIGTLARALNAMAGSLVGKIADLEQERAKATAILDAMVEGVVAVDARDQVLAVNQRARAMFGLSTGSEGRPFMEAIRHGDLHAIVRGSRGMGTGAVVHREVRLLAPVPRTVEVNAVPMVLAGNDPGVGVVLVLYDVTDLRRLEVVRTEFVANVSHELRTPLTAIQGYLETLLGGALEEREHARRFLDIAYRHTERLGRLLNDLTDLSNIELNKVKLALGPVALDEVIDSVVAIIQPRADARRVTLAAEVARDLPPAHADHDRLEQILINLVDNAVKYTPEDGRVTVRASGAVSGGVVVVEVTDTGQGIPPADLPRITERFYRVDKARSRELGGTGLGLAIVKHLVIAHGGELTIDSALGRGTTVRFTLPIAGVPTLRV